MISVENLTKCYGPRRALDRVSFQIERGEAIGLLGLNGAGKTTMLKILTSLILPSAGRATVDGLDVVKNARGVRARLGYLPDTPPIYGEMTVRGYLLFAAQLRGLVGREALERVEQVEEMTAIRDVRDERASHLSHGYRQRVGIAQAIVHRPSVLIVSTSAHGWKSETVSPRTQKTRPPIGQSSVAR